MKCLKIKVFFLTSFDQYSPNKLFILDTKLLSFDFSVDVGISTMTYFLMKNHYVAQNETISEAHDLQKDKNVRKTSKIEKA